MKRDLIISYENINEYKLIELTAENIETFTIPIEYVLDIRYYGIIVNFPWYNHVTEWRMPLFLEDMC